MRPVNTNGKEWPIETSNLALDRIRKSVIADLNARDEERSGGKMNASNHWSPVVGIEKKAVARSGEDGEQREYTDTHYVTDPVLAAMKHTGEDEQRLLESRWADFCSEPQAEAPYRKEITQDRREAKLDKMRKGGTEVAATVGSKAVAPTQARLMPQPPPPPPNETMTKGESVQKRRGRPKGSRNKARPPVGFQSEV